MASYMIQVSYTTAAVAAFIASPQDRTDVIRRALESLGGRLHSLYLCFGEYDVVGIFEAPDNVSAAAFAAAIKAGGACKAIRTTPLLSTAEGVAVQRKAASTNYKSVVAKK
ncbi:MAG TPA: GYD domain-containing protein [Acidobacteriaceae bacterium]|nr:GYD domain-containing protein [Acidobacteriaceae bacterium]